MECTLILDIESGNAGTDDFLCREDLAVLSEEEQTPMKSIS
jgi:hypothetical protein